MTDADRRDAVLWLTVGPIVGGYLLYWLAAVVARLWRQRPVVTKDPITKRLEVRRDLRRAAARRGASHR